MRIDDLWNWLDLSAQFLFDLVQSESEKTAAIQLGQERAAAESFFLLVLLVLPVVIGDEIDGNAQVTEAAGTTDTMQVGLGHLGEVEVDDHVDGLDVDTTGEQVGADQVAAGTVAEVVENAVAVVLTHLGVNVEA